MRADTINMDIFVTTEIAAMAGSPKGFAMLLRQMPEMLPNPCLHREGTPPLKISKYQCFPNEKFLIEIFTC